MKNAKLQFNTPEDIEAVYYESFMHCDVEVMAALWDEGDVICVHPGSGVIMGYDAVIRSWKHIFNGAHQPELTYSVINRSQSDDLAVHLVAEEIATGEGTAAMVLATNVYRKGKTGWLMIEHHASLVPLKPNGQTL